MTASEALKYYKNKIGFLETEMLLQHLLGITREKLHLDANQIVLGGNQNEVLKKSVGRLLDDEPLAYILGYKDFFKDRFFVGPGVLIPRPESELVVEIVLKNKSAFRQIADFGAGSGCIGISILAEYPDSHLLSVESSPEAFKYLQKNAARFKNVKCVLQDVETLNLLEKFDVVVANPPYISFDDQEVQNSVRRYEPSSALFSDEDGLSHFKQWTLKAFEILNSKGLYVSEIGYNQGERALKIAQQKFINCCLVQDLNGLDRVIFGFKA